MLKGGDSDQLGLQAGLGLDVKDYGMTIPLGQGFSGRIAQSGAPQIVLDTRTDGNIASDALRERASTLWGVPLQTPNSGILGTLLGQKGNQTQQPQQQQQQQQPGVQQLLDLFGKKPQKNPPPPPPK